VKLGRLVVAGVLAIPPDYLDLFVAASATCPGLSWTIPAAIAKVESDFGRNMATSSAVADGPGQFLPSSWASFGRGGDPYDYRDVIPAMARYLLAHGAPADLRRAVYAYNHSWAYVDQVLGLAASYGLGAVGVGSTSERALAAALAQRGKPDLFGAAGPDAFDCSGLVQWAYRQTGVLAPRTAQQQFDRARPTAAADLRPGDLIFFTGTSSATSDWITHVSIYAGNGQMVVAPRAGEVVRLESLAMPYWRAHVTGFGRPPPLAEPDVRVAGAGEVRW